jgi:hypothetical protein
MADIYKEVDRNESLRNYCRNATDKEGDTFVGIKSEMVDGKHMLTINFPIGYDISDNEDEVRSEIVELVAVLQDYNDQASRISKIMPEQVLKTVRFPVQSYFFVMFDYLNNGTYMVKEEKYISGISGPISWGQTIRKEQPIVQPNGFIYSQYRVKTHSDTDKDLITEIYNYCVYQSYLKLGWIYKLQPLHKPVRKRDNATYIKYLHSKFLQTNRDNDKRLFRAMLDILNFCNSDDEPERFYFGTNSFEYVWERLIQFTFGNVDKIRYFPKTKWTLRIGNQRENHPLEPDTIMQANNNIYILDAKYYKYGVSFNASDLPNSSSINKQISYGEYVATNDEFQDERDRGMQIYNAFLMPFNRTNDLFNNHENYQSIGEATADWKHNESENEYSFERIQGILVDVKKIISNKIKANNSEIVKLAKAIEESLQQNDSIRNIK